uniref:Uncharacterized protein n=1 Tax=Chromera velia CCMP2878 TaxID=1169474 RepID=A0A0G4FFK6_9ALVE|eukprot:Cvel_16726.t1-p1 / transcript=Cvel_16726.t1 / gene=Cvel_16726 / organism=Chromera_velia_CCMP2878 / gene_product=hypothetical protein / transcript_product=hypothetical protein / location=Cvel_scaffold1301:621-5619(-) / protein_length=170 / sequence_SO=supercontig / SO=protein_coding / is_pseudo=false
MVPVLPAWQRGRPDPLRGVPLMGPRSLDSWSACVLADLFVYLLRPLATLFALFSSPSISLPSSSMSTSSTSSIGFLMKEATLFSFLLYLYEEIGVVLEQNTFIFLKPLVDLFLDLFTEGMWNGSGSDVYRQKSSYSRLDKDEGSVRNHGVFRRLISTPLSIREGTGMEKA